MKDRNTGVDCQGLKAPKASKKERRARRRATFLREHKLDILYALSFVGDAGSIAWLENAAAKDSGANVKEIAEKVRQPLETSP